MSGILLQKLANNDINFEHFKKWILSQGNRSDFKCSQNEFLTYFLNFIHEEINIQNKFGNNSVKCTPRKIKPPANEKKSLRKSLNLLDKSSTYPLSSVKSLEESFNTSCNSHTSTPKNSKICSDSELNASCFSPVSPLYRDPDHNTSKHNKHTVCLGDFLVKKSSKKKAVVQKLNDDSSKRITPTSLNQGQTNETFKTSNSFNDFNTKEIACSDLNTNRMFLAKERIKILSRRESDDGSVSVNSKTVSLSEQKDQIEPQLNLVTFKNQLNILSDIFIVILNNDLVLNVTGEIYFLMSLLIINQYILDSADESQMGINFLNDEEKFEIRPECQITGCSDYFETIHNILYFSVRCLETQFHVLKYYDKSTLKLLSLNKRLKQFSVKFVERLRRLSEKKHDRIIEIIEGRSNVRYNLDTDTKNNFSSEVSFLSFRKQRDLFFDILRIWEKNHLLPDWSFQIGLGGKIKTLLGLQGETTHFMHFARLFKAQLLSSCGMSVTEESFSEENLFPSNFPSIDPNKLSRLKNRLVTKQSSNGLNSLPNFIGYQEFYKEFILVAANHCFNIHLQNIFIAEIIELNENKFNLAGLEESDADVDVSTRKSFAMNMRHLRVLAKFLGFLECIPYTLETNNYPENMFASHINIRRKKTPSLDVKQLLLSSIRNNTVVLTVPWLVEYLSMLDFVTLRLPYYLSLYEVLFQIYHSYEKPTKSLDYNNALVKFCLGWLFDLSHFPDTEYAKFCASKNAHFVRKSHTLDDIDIIDQNILYLCCPYLEEIKKMLTNSFENCRTITVKHITPVTAAESSEQISKKRLEQQLEEAFFNGQPESVRKTVEFVSERLASACVKQMCNTIVPPFKKDASKQIKEFLETQRQEMQVMSPVRERNQKTVLRIKLSQLAQEKLTILHKKCATEVSSILHERLPITVDNLLAIDTLPQTKTTCVSIASRMCNERLKQWISAHMSVNIFMKDFEKELHKMWNSENRKPAEEKIVFALPSSGRRENHNEECLSGFHLSEKIKNLSVDILEKSNEVNKEVIVDVVKQAYETLTDRCDINDVITACICNSLLDLTLLLIAHRPDLMPQDDLSKLLIKIWRWYSASRNDLFNDLLCPKNVALLRESANRRKVWNNFAKFVAFLIKENVLVCDNLENQCIAFFKRDWEPFDDVPNLANGKPMDIFNLVTDINNINDSSSLDISLIILLANMKILDSMQNIKAVQIFCRIFEYLGVPEVDAFAANLIIYLKLG